MIIFFQTRSKARAFAKSANKKSLDKKARNGKWPVVVYK